MPVKIVPFLPEHIPPAIELWRHSPGVRLNDTDTPESLTRFLQRNAGLSLAVLEEGELVGTLLCGHDGCRGYLRHLAIAERCRRMGLGRELVGLALAALRAIDIQKCHVFVVHDNPFGGLFWERLGWTLRDDVHVYSHAATPEKN